MDTDSRAPRTAAGRQMLDNHIYWGEWYQHNWLAAILAIEDEAQRPPWTDQQAIAAVMERESQAYEQGRAEAAADPVAGLQDELMEAMDRIAKSKVTAPGAYQQGWIDALKAMADELAALPVPAPEEGERDE